MAAELPLTMYTYCLDCGWQCADNMERADRDLSKCAIDHFVETGHTVESVRLPPPMAIEH